MKRHLAAIGSAIALACSPAFGQAASADAAATQAARQVMDAMHARATMQSTLQAMEAQMPAQVRAATLRQIDANPALSAQQKAEVTARFEKQLPDILARAHALFADPTLVDEMIEQMVPLYASAYSVDELHQLAAFYSSPLGQKVMANAPRQVAQIMEISQRVTMPRIQKMMQPQAVAGH